MAAKLKEAANDEVAGKGHNSDNRDPEYIKQKVREAVELLKPQEKLRSNANDAMKKIRRDLKSETGINGKDFDFARRLAEMEDEDEQKEKMSNMSIAFAALSEGQQMNFIDVMEEEEEDKKSA